MTLPERLNTTDFSLLLGNGINRYASTEHNLNYSWRGVLRHIAMNHGAMDAHTADSILDDQTAISFPEFVDLITLFNTGKDIDRPTLKQELSALIADWRTTSSHTRMVRFCHSHEIPILTTNYDTLLAQSMDEIINFVTEQNARGRRKHPEAPMNQRGRALTRYYPWHSFYSDRDLSTRDAFYTFAIWHIHGIYHYPDSIRLGLMDYMNFITRARGWIRSGSGARWKNLDKYGEWEGANSWLDLFFHKPVVIAGLALDVQETPLRWLLIQRARLFRRNPEKGDLSKWYYVSVREDGPMPAAKQHFIESLGGQILTYDSFEEFYAGAFGG